MLNRKSFLAVLLLGLLTAWSIVAILLQCDFWLYSSISVFVTIICVFSIDFKNNIYFVLFLLSFFTFLMGGQLANALFGYRMTYVNSDEDYSFLSKIILLSLMSLSIGYIIGGRLFTPRKEKQYLNDSVKEKNYRIISKMLFYIFAIPWFSVLMEQVIIVRSLSYADYYTFQSQLPFVFDFLSDACPFVFCFFLGTFPSKKEAKWPMLIVAAYAGISMFTGRRLYFVTYFLLLITYLLVRNKEGNELWITKRQILFIVVAIPVLIVFLYSYRYIRYGLAVQTESFFDSFVGFFAQQGYSANLIVTSKNYASIIPDHPYSFAQTIRFVRMNPFTRYVLGLDYSQLYAKTSAYSALNGGSFASLMSYLLMPTGYAKGLGTGTCYIAELYTDGGVLGVFLGNFIYGVIIKRIISLKKNRFFGNAIALYMFWNFLISPRYNYDRPFASFLSVSFIFTIITIFLLQHFLKKPKISLEY